MAIKIKTDDDTFIARRKNETFIVDSGTDLVFVNDNLGILASGRSGGRTIRVDGTIDAPLAGSNAIQMECSSQKVERIIIGLTGEVSATGSAIAAGGGVAGGGLVDIRVSGRAEGGVDAIALNCDTATLKNTGTIAGGSFSAVNVSSGNVTISNSGAIEAGTGSGIVSTGRRFDFTNTGTVTSANDVAILLGAGTSGVGTVTIVNEGTISGAADAIRADSPPSNRAFTVINTGDIIGDIDLSGSERNVLADTSEGRVEGDILTGDGDDRIVLINAVVTGSAKGGQGDDTYTISSNDIILDEAVDGGVDTVRGTGDVSFFLPDNFENVILVGVGTTQATGNSADNRMTGSAGVNFFEGAGGEDTIRGGKGNDLLVGGLDSDTFIFRQGDDKDVISDFEIDGVTHDVLDLSSIKGIRNFNDLINNHASDVNGDVVINAGNGDKVTMEDLTVAELRADLFLF